METYPKVINVSTLLENLEKIFQILFMVNKISLQDKIKLVMQRTGMKAADLAYATGLPRESMYKWMKGTRPNDSIVYDKLESFLDGILEKISGEETPVRYNAFFEKAATLKIPLKQPGKAVPLTTAIASSGTIAIIDNEPHLIVDRIEAPFLGEIDGIVEVIGESMEPILKHGCRIAIARLKDSTVLNSGKHYFIIDKNLQGIVRRVYPGETEDTIQLVSDNEDQRKFPPITRSLDQIEAIFQVKASILQY